jgi:hypothetical protein
MTVGIPGIPERVDRGPISSDEVSQAMAHPLYEGMLEGIDQPMRVLYLSRTRRGDLIEVTTVQCDDGTEVLIHAQTMHPAYAGLLNQEVTDG